MGANSLIEWCDHTFNPWIGCTKVSPGCDNCYAEKLDARFGGAHWGPKAPRQRTTVSNWRHPRQWNNAAGRAGVKQFVFCASLADVFDNQVEPAWRADLFALIAETPNLIWLLLTKRPQNIGKMTMGIPLPANVWAGTTCENQEEANRRIDELLRAKKALGIGRVFLSVEPMLEAITVFDLDGPVDCTFGPSPIDWVICGGESGGPSSRPMHPGWATSLRDQCEAAGVPFFFKQWGDWAGPGPHQVDMLLGPGTKISHPKYDVALVEGPGPGRLAMTRVGKRLAGRLLDGVEHNGRPAP